MAVAPSLTLLSCTTICHIDNDEDHVLVTPVLYLSKLIDQDRSSSDRLLQRRIVWLFLPDLSTCGQHIALEREATQQFSTPNKLILIHPSSNTAAAASFDLFIGATP